MLAENPVPIPGTGQQDVQQEVAEAAEFFCPSRTLRWDGTRAMRGITAKNPVHFLGGDKDRT